MLALIDPAGGRLGVAGSLEGPLAKFSRAERQVDMLQKEIEAIWPPSQPWPVRTERRRRGLEYRFYLGELPEVDPDWLLWAGEIMFDMRSALDHLGYQLHVRHFRGNLPSQHEGVPMFPIYDSPARFKKWGENRIRLLGDRDQRAIKHLQPYITRRDKWAGTRFWLGKLNQLHNIDKHRKLHLVAAAQTVTVGPTFPPATGWQTIPVWGEVESNSHVETWTFTKPPAVMQAHRGATIEITLNPEGEFVSLIRFLRRTRASVRAVLHRFADRFPEIEGAFDPTKAYKPPVGAVRYSPRTRFRP